MNLDHDSLMLEKDNQTFGDGFFKQKIIVWCSDEFCCDDKLLFFDIVEPDGNGQVRATSKPSSRCWRISN